MFFDIRRSQGAKIFDQVISEVIVDLAKNFSIKIIQQTSEDNIKKLRKKFITLKILKIKFFSFEENLLT